MLRKRKVLNIHRQLMEFGYDLYKRPESAMDEVLNEFRE
jgi:hypothetical protein